MEDGRIPLETGRAERSVWLMKCPPVVSRSWQSSAAGSSASPNPVVAKVVLSLDPLHPDDPSSLQFKMEMAQTDSANTPKSYTLNMFKDFVPMCVFSESNQGKFSLEGKVEHKFDMEIKEEIKEEKNLTGKGRALLLCLIESNCSREIKEEEKKNLTWKLPWLVGVQIHLHHRSISFLISVSSAPSFLMIMAPVSYLVVKVVAHQLFVARVESESWRQPRLYLPQSHCANLIDDIYS